MGFSNEEARCRGRQREDSRRHGESARARGGRSQEGHGEREGGRDEQEDTEEGSIGSTRRAGEGQASHTPRQARTSAAPRHAAFVISVAQLNMSHERGVFSLSPASLNPLPSSSLTYPASSPPCACSPLLCRTTERERCAVEQRVGASTSGVSFGSTSSAPRLSWSCTIVAAQNCQRGDQGHFMLEERK